MPKNKREMPEMQGKKSSFPPTSCPEPAGQGGGAFRCFFSTKKTNQSGRQYHYYVCVGDDKRAFRECPVHRVSANDIDRIVQNQIEIILNTPTMLAKLSLGDIAPDVRSYVYVMVFLE